MTIFLYAHCTYSPCHKNSNLDIKQIFSVYVSMSEEVCTQSLIRSVLKDNKNLFVPYFNREDMFMVQIKDFEDYSSLPIDTYGVR